MNRIKLLCISMVVFSLSAFGIGNNMDSFTNFYKVHPATTDMSKGVLILTHGILEHSERYLHLIDKLNEQGYTVYRYDLRGHGHSDGARAYVKNFNEYVEDLDSMVKLVKDKEGNVPLYLFGHSMGGLITFLYSKKLMQVNDDVRGIILSAPALNIPMTLAKKAKLLFAKKLRYIVPYQLAGEKIDRDVLSDDEEMKRLHREDKMIIEDSTISLGVELTGASVESRQYVSAPSSEDPPMFIIQGTADKVVNASLNIESAQKLVSEENLLVIEGGLHETLHSKPATRNLVINEILKFINLNN